MALRVPDNMWSMRCEMGWPILTVIPGIIRNDSRTATRKASLLRSCIRSMTSSSLEFTPSACSSSSARPVRRAVETTSGCANKVSSTKRAMRSDSGNEVPGNVTIFTVSVPSLNGGRNVRPSHGKTARATRRRRTASPCMMLGCPKTIVRLF